MTIDCRPRGFFSWDFTLESAEALHSSGQTADVSMGWFSETGRIYIDNKEYVVAKEFFAGRWTLEKRGERFAEAKKSLLRTFRVYVHEREYVFQPAFPMSRQFCLKRNEVEVARFVPAHLFSRCVTIECKDEEVDLLTLAFLFLLQTVINRRGGSGGG